jgi:hypothetical protein
MKDLIRRKVKLSPNEYRECCRRLSSLRGRGVITGTALDYAEGPKPRILIEQVGGVIESRISPWRMGLVGYTINVAVTNQTSTAINVIDLELRTDWDDRFFMWLEPISLPPSAPQVKNEHKRQVFVFPGRVDQFERDEVLNERLLKTKRLPAKRRLEGLLLAVGSEIPSRLVHGQLEEVTLVITTVDCEESARLQLWVDRSEQSEKSKAQRKRLFSELKKPAIIKSDQELGLERATQREAESTALEDLARYEERDG